MVRGLKVHTPGVNVRIPLGIFGGGVRPGSPYPDPYGPTEKCNFPHLFSDPVS